MISSRRSDNSQTEFPVPQRRNKQEEIIEFEEKKIRKPNRAITAHTIGTFNLLSMIKRNLNERIP